MVGAPWWSTLRISSERERAFYQDRSDRCTVDSRELKDGRLDSIRVPDIDREQLRSLFRSRNDLVKD